MASWWKKKRGKSVRTFFVVVVEYGGAGGFFLTCKDLERMFDHSFPACTFLFVFVFEVEISSCTLILLYTPGSVHSGSVGWDDCGRMFHDKSCVSSFLDKFPHYAWTVS